MKIEIKFDQAPEPPTPPGVAPDPVEVLEGGEEFLEALSIRLNEIVQKPNGRFVITYVSGKPGAKDPPRVQ